METNQQLYDNALRAIQDLFSDSSVSKRECAENLQSLIYQIDAMISSLGDIGEDSGGSHL